MIAETDTPLAPDRQRTAAEAGTAVAEPRAEEAPVAADAGLDDAEDSGPRGVLKSRVLLAVKLAAAAALVGYLASSGKIRGDVVAEGLRAPGALLWAVAAIGIVVLCGVVRWRLLLRALDVHLSWKEIAQLTLIGNFFNSFMPGGVGGDPFKALYASRHAPAGRRVEAATTVLIDRVLGLATLVLISVIGLAASLLAGGGDDAALAASAESLGARAAPLARVLGWVALGGGVLLLPLLSGRVRRSALLQAALARLPATRVLGRVARTMWLALTHKGAVAGALVTSAIAHLATIAVFYAFGVALGVVPSPLQHVVLVPVGLTINALPGPPAGVGVGELAFEGLYALALGTPASIGAEICLLWRMVVMAWSLVGGVAYVLYRRP